MFWQSDKRYSRDILSHELNHYKNTSKATLGKDSYGDILIAIHTPARGKKRRVEELNYLAIDEEVESYALESAISKTLDKKRKTSYQDELYLDDEDLKDAVKNKYKQLEKKALELLGEAEKRYNSYGVDKKIVLIDLSAD